MHKSKILIICSNVCSFFVFSAVRIPFFVLCHRNMLSLSEKVVFKRVLGWGWTTIMLIYLILAVCAYIIMFKYYIESRKRTCPSVMNKSTLQMFQTSKFYIAMLLIISYLVLHLIPRLAFWILDLFHIQPSIPIKALLFLPQYLSDTVDALIYICLYSPVKREAKKQWKLMILKLINRPDDGQRCHEMTTQETATYFST